MNFLQVEQTVPMVGPDILFSIGGFPVSNGLLLSIALTILFLFGSIKLKNSLRLLPSKLQGLMELLFESIVDLIDQITGDSEVSKRILPLIGTLFIYIGVANLITIVPGVTSITYDGLAIFRTPTSALNTTLALALAMIILTQLVSIRDWGVLGHIGKYVQIKEVFKGFRQGLGEGFLAIIQFLVGLLDIIAEIARVISLSLRLFGNMYAGEVLLVILMAAVAYAVPVLWLGLSIFFGLVQAVVFGALVAAYYTLALKPKEEGVVDN